ncbi:LVIVD repeat-containing protein [Sediminitomix flava]|uniref:LVIVD repeat-containing protein n=1 Tax=Sediminitomix flava TaxID=379075 RepID=A0A315ZBD7_SEDFL|nr:hypothetical protein [Sediminitomix flava]PWJ42612.1 LVIVD repeat-containing protein [Sediminitomix flava]
MKKYILYFSAFLLATLISCEGSEDASLSPSGDLVSSGKGGSLARFAITGNHLYTVDQYDMQVYSLEDPAKPVLTNSIYIGNDIETIFPLGDQLYIGSQSGMYIYDISNREIPSFLGVYHHIVSCDPVVSDGVYAYVTLRSSETWCNRGLNQLDIVNVSDPTNIQLVSEVNMDGPKGLGVSGNTLMVCDQSFIRVLDVENRKQPKHKFTIDLVANDVIPNNGNWIVSSPEGLFQYRLNGESFEKLSAIY